MEYDQLAVNDQIYSWSEALGEVVGPKGQPMVKIRNGAANPSSLRRDSSFNRPDCRPSSRTRGPSAKSRVLARATSLQVLPSQEEERESTERQVMDRINSVQRDERDEAMERIQQMKVDISKVYPDVDFERI